MFNFKQKQSLKVFYKKRGVLKNFTKLTGNTSARVSYLIKLQFGLQLYIKRLCHRCIPVTFHRTPMSDCFCASVLTITFIQHTFWCFLEECFIFPFNFFQVFMWKNNTKGDSNLIRMVPELYQWRYSIVFIKECKQLQASFHACNIFTC